jgi:hypothetical protein
VTAPRAMAPEVETLRGWRLTVVELALRGRHPDFGPVTLGQLLATSPRGLFPPRRTGTPSCHPGDQGVRHAERPRRGPVLDRRHVGSLPTLLRRWPRRTRVGCSGPRPRAGSSRRIFEADRRGGDTGASGSSTVPRPRPSPEGHRSAGRCATSTARRPSTTTRPG